MTSTRTQATQTGALPHSPSGAPERVYAGLRAGILSLDLPPGTVLDRKEIAAQHGVSQLPVREALQLLAQEGLVQIFPQSRTVVARIDIRQLSETQFLRVSIETEVVRRLAATPRPEAMARARAILNMQRALVESGQEVDMFQELDRRFHLTLFEGVGMQSLHAMLIGRLGHLYRCHRLELPMEGRQQNIVEAHERLLDAIATGDPEVAAASMYRHLSGTFSRIESLRRAHPDFFTDDVLTPGWTPPEPR